jgi:hypothetical protein
MPFDFVIRITTQFVPQGAKAGEPLRVKVGDSVSWGNDTRETHQPWPTDADHNPLPEPPTHFPSDPIPPMQSSRAPWVVPPLPVGIAEETIHYCCKVHNEEIGTIIVTASSAISGGTDP